MIYSRIINLSRKYQLNLYLFQLISLIFQLIYDLEFIQVQPYFYRGISLSNLPSKSSQDSSSCYPTQYFQQTVNSISASQISTHHRDFKSGFQIQNSSCSPRSHSFASVQDGFLPRTVYSSSQTTSMCYHSLCFSSVLHCSK